MGNSLVGDSSHAAGAPGLLHGPQEVLHGSTNTHSST